MIEHKTSLGNFKKKEGSLQKVLKKTQSDKYLMHPPQPKAENYLSQSVIPQESK